jgi:hypothetical protein
LRSTTSAVCVCVGVVAVGVGWLGVGAVRVRLFVRDLAAVLVGPDLVVGECGRALVH